MAPSLRSSTHPSPLPMRKKEPTLASVSSIVATGSRAVSSLSDTTSSLKAASLFRKSAKHDGQPSWSLATVSSRKRSRQETSDENADTLPDRKPRVRQRLISKASVETIREKKSSRQAAEVVSQSSQPFRNSLSRQSSTRTLRGEDSTGPKPLARSSSVNMTDSAPRTCGASELSASASLTGRPFWTKRRILWNRRALRRIHPPAI
ncbi:hypothetical protein EVG20_g1722 [Dentipellis fragilis]|uniref:Uncharacterized protein n=1 Tax=Dentipellis fragilis TaxID=205917 RepID=A0A4Y9ZBW3_9AGAM|nr:hypothetical protein EVG20_g1722 [Dentipellis fragilis]